MAEAAFDLQGHRGARALFPENTLEGFRSTAALGVHSCEIDIAVTADDVPVLCHDAALNPDITRGPDGAWLQGPGPLVRSLRLAELQRFDVGRIRPGTAYAARFAHQHPVDGARIPTLRDLFAAEPQLCLNIELKLYPLHRDWTVAPEVMTALVLREVDRADAGDRVTLQSFDWRPMRWLRRTRPEIARSFLTEASAAATAWWDVPDGWPVPALPRAVAEAGGRGATWAAAHADLTRAQVEEAHALGMRVLAWTVNQADDMARLVGWGVDGLITDDPALAQTVLRQLGIPEPASDGLSLPRR